MTSDSTRPTDDQPAFSGASSRSLIDMAALMGGRVWVERQLFELLGGWAASTPEVDVKLFLADVSRRHGWHAQVWFDRLPVLRELDPDAQVAPPSTGLANLITDLSGLDDATTLERLVAVYRVLVPRLVTAYSETLAGLGEAADASVARWSRVLITDDLDELERAEGLIARLVDSPDGEASAKATQARVSALIADGTAIPI